MYCDIKFEVSAGLYCEFLNCLIEQNIPITHIKSTDLGFTAVCQGQDYMRIAKLARKFQCRINCVKKRGIYFKVKNIIKRKGLILGCAAVIFLMYFFGNIIWRIDVQTDNQQIKRDIYNVLYENDVYAGALFSKEKNSSLVQKISMQVDNVGYVTLNFYKGVLNCIVDETLKKEEYVDFDYSGNINASLDGIITDLRVYSGFSQVSIGQSVSKGDLLVSSVYLDKNGNVQQVVPSAYIEAYCVKEYQTQVYFNKTEEVYSGRIETEKTVKFLNNQFKYKKADIDEFEDYEVRKSYANLEILGFKLPATVQTDTYYEKVKTDINSDSEKAMAVAQGIIKAIIKQDKSLIEQDYSEYEQITLEDSIILKCKMYGYYDISLIN